MGWSRTFKIKKNKNTLGKVICTSNADNTEFYAEIIITDLNYIQVTQNNKDYISNFGI